jgi:hypothetical protein
VHLANRTPYFRPLLAGLLLVVSMALAGEAKPADSLASRFRPVLHLGFSTTALGLPLWLQAGVAKGRHTGLVGLGFNVAEKSNPWMVGALYQYFPNPPGRRFDVFFQIEAEWATQGHQKGQAGLYGGYGLNIRIGKTGFFRTNYGLGWLFGKTDGPSTATGNLSGNFRIGFGRRF